MVPADPSWFTGPFGGLLAVVFGTGLVGGYGFASRTVLSIARQQRAEDKIVWDRERMEWAKERAGLRDDMARMEAAHKEERRQDRSDFERERAEHRNEIAELKTELREFREMMLGIRNLPARARKALEQRTPFDEPEWQRDNLDKLKDVPE